MKRTTVIKTAAVLGVASLSLAACGGDSTSTEASTAPQTAAAATAAASEECKSTTLTLGSVLPQTGSLAFLGRPMISGVQYAVKQINDAGGVNGAEVVYIPLDEGDSKTDVASQSVDSLLAQGATAFVGAASTDVSLNILEKATSNGMLMVSPSNTGPVMSTVDDKGLYFRTAPSDALQGLVLADRAVADGNTEVAVMARSGPYGEGLAKAFIDPFTEAGGTVTAEVYHNPDATSFEAEVAEIKASNPKAIMLVTYDEVTKIGQELIKQGLGPQDIQWYLVDGNLSTTAYEAFEPGIMKGTIGTKAIGQDVAEFNKEVQAFDPELTDVIYAAEAFDAATMIALAAQAAGCADGPAIAAQMLQIAGGGEQCSSFADCAALLAEGKDIDLEGETGPLDLTEIGDPSSATIGVFEYGDKNTEFVEVDRAQSEVPVS